MAPCTELPRADLQKRMNEEKGGSITRDIEGKSVKDNMKKFVMCNLQIWREHNSKLTIPNNTKLLKNTFLYCFGIVQHNLTRWIMILPWHINIQKFLQGTTFILDFKKPRKNLNSCFWKYGKIKLDTSWKEHIPWKKAGKVLTFTSNVDLLSSQNFRTFQMKSITRHKKIEYFKQ